jgi:hypothetical protein
MVFAAMPVALAQTYGGGQMMQGGGQTYGGGTMAPTGGPALLPLVAGAAMILSGTGLLALRLRR